MPCAHGSCGAPREEAVAVDPTASNASQRFVDAAVMRRGGSSPAHC
jgi:hypothetical protein